MQYNKLLTILFVMCPFLTGQDTLKNQTAITTQPPALEPVPDIQTYPEVIQEYDRLFRRFMQWQRDVFNRASIEEKSRLRVPDDLLVPLAQKYISIQIFHDKVDGTGAFNKYRGRGGGSGLLSQQIQKHFQHPWDLLLRGPAILVVEPYKEEVYRRGLKHPEYGYPVDAVCFARVVDDVLGNMDQDTVMFRHSTVWFTENMPLESRPHLLVVLYQGSRVLYAGKEGPIYFTEYIGESKPQYLRIVDGIIQDPYNVLGVNGQPYEEYKEKMRRFLQENNIHP